MWPVDANVIYQDAQFVLLLGTIKAAQELEAVETGMVPLATSKHSCKSICVATGHAAALRQVQPMECHQTNADSYDWSSEKYLETPPDLIKLF